jgi:hypothetical protein
MEYTRSSFESSGLDDRKCVFTFKNGETREGVLTTFINSEQFNFLPANCMSAYKRLENEKSQANKEALFLSEYYATFENIKSIEPVIEGVNR